ncbi:DUF2691 family protein [Solibacillus silvestris]|uniref:DUF2691 family protein n=1 Tax=Solibacillus silvestris TaxID=76853 RepID=UPI003F7F979A
MKRGLTFEMPNKYGKLLGKLLKPIDISAFNWCIGGGESYKVVNNQLAEDLFTFDKEVIEGAALKNLLENNEYYIIFADLKAYPKGKEFSHIETYEDFLISNCELVFLVVDSSYTTIYCKDQSAIEYLYKNALKCGFENIDYLTDENDARTSLTAF